MKLNKWYTEDHEPSRADPPNSIRLAADGASEIGWSFAAPGEPRRGLFKDLLLHRDLQLQIGVLIRLLHAHKCYIRGGV